MKTLDILSQPIQPEEIEWRVQTQTKTGKLIVVPYITNRCVMERFDKQFGWDGWESQFQEIKDGFLCTLTVHIRPEDSMAPQWRSISKTDVSDKTDIEPLKGGVSGAMKRCAVQFGLGRSLYTYPKIMIDTPDKYIPEWANQQLDVLVKKLNDGSYRGGDMVVLKASYQKA